MTPAVAYYRCSGMGQVSGDTWSRQSEAVQKFAASQGFEIVAEYRDEGVSGTKELENRPGLAAALERIENNGVKLLIVESADRLARDSMIAELIVRQFQKSGGRILTASGVDLTEGNDANPTAKLIRSVLAAVADFDRCVTVLKLRAARQRMKARSGRCEGVKPFGELPGEEPILAQIVTFAGRDLDAKEIAETCNLHALPTRSGKPWRASTIRKILSRQRISLALRKTEAQIVGNVQD